MSTKKRLDTFRRDILSWYRKNGRHTLPWRRAFDPYHVLVSEIMLQQTQVDRVIPKYKRFLSTFPTVQVLARASLGAVLKEWQGLGYNRRAKHLHECAKSVVLHHEGIFPKTSGLLQELSGIGPYTASAVMAFAYNKPVIMIETNIRTVFLHHFFADREKVHDKELLPLIEASLPSGKSRVWYAALMDYGSYLKKEKGNASRKSRHYTKQSRFKGSVREIRGAILRELAEGAKTKEILKQKTGADERFDTVLRKLRSEGLVTEKNKMFRLG